jgi:hypothetical protein
MYQYLINHNTHFSNKFIWKLKIPLKIKIFLWYVQQGVILTKDNLAKRNWTGSQNCCFCDCQETIKHLFFDCQRAKTIWKIVHIATRLTPPRFTSHMFRRWLTGIVMEECKIIFMGVEALCWAIWCTRNDDLVFEKKKQYTFMQVTCRGIYWLRFWAWLQHEDRGRLFAWPTKHWRLSFWTYSPTTDEEAIMEFAYDFFLPFSFVISLLFLISNWGCLVGRWKVFGCHIGWFMRCRERFSDTN